jgi:hypothetical protein
MELSIVHIAFDAETNCDPPIINYFIFICILKPLTIDLIICNNCLQSATLISIQNTVTPNNFKTHLILTLNRNLS